MKSQKRAKRQEKIQRAEQETLQAQQTNQSGGSTRQQMKILESPAEGPPNKNEQMIIAQEKGYQEQIMAEANQKTRREAEAEAEERMNLKLRRRSREAEEMKAKEKTIGEMELNRAVQSMTRSR